MHTVKIVPGRSRDLPREADSPAAPGYRTITLLFSDIAGFTEMTERLGDSEALEVVKEHDAIVRSALEAHGGYEVDRAGDAFLIAFPAATTALLCAVAIQAALADRGTGDPDRGVAVRIGVHSGEPLRQGDRFFGKAIILATRIAGHARPGEILVSEVTRDLAECAPGVAFDAGRDLALKGISGTRRVYRVMLPEAPLSAVDLLESRGESVIRREGDYWTIVHERRSFRLRDTKGLRYLAELLHNAGTGVCAIDLAAGGRDPQLAGPESFADAGPVLDLKARAAYRGRLGELRGELEEATRLNDCGRAARAQAEIEFLSSELARATGLGTSDRRVASAAERARLSVTMAIKAALRRIAENDRLLGRYLAMTVKTGRCCSYTPDPRAPIIWRR